MHRRNKVSEKTSHQNAIRLVQSINQNVITEVRDDETLLFEKGEESEGHRYTAVEQN